MLVFKTYLVTSYEALDFTWTVSFGNLKYKNSPTCFILAAGGSCPYLSSVGGYPLNGQNPLKRF